MRNPFIAGTWVRGENFFGREAMLRDILDGEGQCIWVVGARRLGKTSVLKQLECLALRSPDSAFVPLYWDLQGSDDPRGFAESLLTAVEDDEAFRRATGLSVEDVESLPLLEMLATIVRRTVRSGWKLLLLVDEAEELIKLGQNGGAHLPRLRRLFQKGPEIRTVLTSTRRLARIDEQPGVATSPFLQAFIPPLYLTPLSPDETRSLLARGQFPSEEIETVIERTGCHPFLVQLIAGRLFESRDLGAVLDQVASDEMVSNFLAVDFQTLDAAERDILAEVARHGRSARKELARAAGRSEEAVEPTLFGLRMMGYLVAAGDHFSLGNWFFDRWLRRVVASGVAPGGFGASR